MTVNRPLVGILAVICLGAGGILLIQASTSALGGTLLRVGVLLGALWLALPFRKSSPGSARVSPFVLIGVLAAMLFLVRRPAALIPSLLLLAVLWLLLRPWHRPGVKPSRQTDRKPPPT